MYTVFEHKNGKLSDNEIKQYTNIVDEIRNVGEKNIISHFGEDQFGTFSKTPNNHKIYGSDLLQYKLCLELDDRRLILLPEDPNTCKLMIDYYIPEESWIVPWLKKISNISECFSLRYVNSEQMNKEEEYANHCDSDYEHI